ncbi:cytochrome-c peroxidase [Profundibacter sp.]
MRYAVIVLVASAGVAQAEFESVEALGEALFFDVNLSQNRTQSCATCHAPEHVFVDVRETAAGRAFSLGDDGTSLGDRNAPTVTYAMLIPPFQINDMGFHMGGQFWDGSARDLAAQAGGPPLNPIEMGMPDKPSVVLRLRESEDYIAGLEAYFGADVFDDTDAAYGAMTQAIAAYESTDLFAPFDSKYDRALRGEYEMTAQEALGKDLFFNKDHTNCSMCHMLKQFPTEEGETFTAYEYFNIGVPTNMPGREANGVLKGKIDFGLLGNPEVNDVIEMGKFRTSGLRNIAVTGPYMHNGIFRDLRTVVLFYNKYNTLEAEWQINPETGKGFGWPEVPKSLAVRELTHGPALTNAQIDALVAFLETLTDERYEHLLEE